MRRRAMHRFPGPGAGPGRPTMVSDRSGGSGDIHRFVPGPLGAGGRRLQGRKCPKVTVDLPVRSTGKRTGDPPQPLDTAIW